MSLGIIQARMWSNRNSHSLLVGMQNGEDTVEDTLTICYKTKHEPYEQVVTPRGIHPSELKTYGHTQRLLKCYSSIILNCQNLKPTSAGEWIKGGTSRHWNINQH